MCNFLDFLEETPRSISYLGNFLPLHNEKWVFYRHYASFSFNLAHAQVVSSGLLWQSDMSLFRPFTMMIHFGHFNVKHIYGYVARYYTQTITLNHRLFYSIIQRHILYFLFQLVKGKKKNNPTSSIDYSETNSVFVLMFIVKLSV